MRLRGSVLAAIYSRLGLWRYERGDVAGAERALRRADELGGAWGAFRLGVLFHDSGDLAAAEAAYRRAVDRGNPHATTNLGVILRRRGATAATPPAPGADQAGEGQAAFHVGMMLAQQGDIEEARGAWLSCMATGDPEWAPQAGAALGDLLWKQGQLEAAAAVLQRAVGFRHPQWSVDARLTLGVILAEQGDRDGAAEAYRAVIASGTSERVPYAWFNLGRLHQQAAAFDDAAEAYRMAVASGHADAAPRAAVNLGVVLSDLGDWDGAREAFTTAIASGHPEQASMAAMNLGALYALLGDEQRAAQAFGRGADLGTGPFAEESERRLQILSSADAELAFEPTTDASDDPADHGERYRAHAVLDEQSMTSWAKGQRTAAFQQARRALVRLGPVSGLDAARARLAIATAMRLASWHETAGDMEGAYRTCGEVFPYTARLRECAQGYESDHRLAVANRNCARYAAAAGHPHAEVIELAGAAVRHATAAFHGFERTHGRGLTADIIMEELCLSSLCLDEVIPGPADAETVRGAIRWLTRLERDGLLSAEGREALGRRATGGA